MKKLTRTLAFLLAAAELLAPLCGCLSPVSLDAYGYVISIAADRGADKKYRFTLLLQRELSEPGSEREGGASILAAEGDSLEEAVDAVEGGVPYTLSFARTNFFIFSSEIASSGDISELLSISFDSLKIRTSAFIAVSKGPAYEFVGGLSANNDANIRKLQEALMLDMEKTGMVKLMSVSRLFEAAGTGNYDYCSAYGEYFPDIKTDMEQKNDENEGKDPLESASPGGLTGGLKSRMIGAALFNGFVMTETLTREETMYLNLACGDLKNGAVAVKNSEGGGETVLILTPKSTKREVAILPGGPAARVEIKLFAGVHSKPAGMSEAELEGEVRRLAEEQIREGLESVFGKCRAANSDAMRFGCEAVKRFSSREDWEAYCWKRRYAEMTAVFSVELTVTDKCASGRMF